MFVLFLIYIASDFAFLLGVKPFMGIWVPFWNVIYVVSSMLLGA